MPKDYITILNRLPYQFKTGNKRNIGWDKQKQCFKLEDEIATLRITRDKRNWIIGYYDINNINNPILRRLASPNIEDCIEFILKELSNYIDIHDILQP